MLFSKVWMVLLAAAASVAFSMAFVAPRPLGREVVKARVADVHRAAHIVELRLRRETRDWIDTAAQMARDRTVARMLQQASDDPTRVGELSGPLGRRILALVAMIEPSVRPELVIATDARGKQIFRMGPGADSYKPGKDGLEGYPLVEDALRGYRRDDTWNLDGELYLMAGSPAIARTKARYVGAIILGEAVNDAFARRFKQQVLPADLAFFLEGKLVGASVAAATIKGLPARFVQKDRQAEIKRAGRTAAVPLEKDAPKHHAVMAPLPGEAGTQQAFYAVLGRTATSFSLGQALALSTHEDTSWASFPWPLMVGGFLAALLVGLILLHWEVNTPLGRFRDEVGKLASGSAARLNLTQYGGRWKAIASLVNKVLERSPGQASPAGPAAKAEGAVTPAPLVAVQPTAVAGSVESKPTAAVSSSQPQVEPEELATTDLEPAPSIEPEELATTDLETAAPPTPENSPAPSKAEPATGLGDRDMTPQVMPSSDQVLASLRERIPDFDSLTGADTVAEEPADLLLVDKSGQPAPEEEAPQPDPVDNDGTLERLLAEADEESVDPEDASTTLDVGHEVPLPEEPRKPLVAEASVETLMSSVPESMAQADEREHKNKDEDLASYIEEVYRDFIAVKRKCGEETEALTLARFETKLRKNRKALQERFGCESVKFSVYVKNGKAALKAIPVKE